jgi:hypothetical protein
MTDSKKWPNGSNIDVGFIGGTPVQQARVIPYFHLWEQYANLKFRFLINLFNTSARVTFDQGESWSYVGTECRAISPPEPTMGFGWIGEDTPEDEVARVVLHEVGHLIGFEHELQQPAAAFEWNEDAVLAYYMGPPNHWSREEVQKQVFDKLAEPGVSHTDFDPLSIMAYAIPPEFDKKGRGVPFNKGLSERDREFAARMYPKETEIL